MEKKIKIYRAKVNEDSINRLSLVYGAANKQKLVYLNEENKLNIQVRLQDEEQRKIVCPILIPDFPIYRQELSDEHTDGYIEFTKEDVLKASKELFKNSKNHNFNIEHSFNTYDIFLSESWIVDNVEFDKSKFYGFEVPIGTWMGVFDLNSDELIQAVKEGSLNGISPEIFAELIFKTELKEETNNDLDELLLAMKNIFENKLNNIRK